MAFRRFAQLTCDTDGCFGVVEGNWEERSSKLQRAQAKRDGWTRVGGKDFCPKCAPTSPEQAPGEG